MPDAGSDRAALVVVRGIGNQAAGSVAAKVARLVADAPPADGAGDGESGLEHRSVTVDGRPVTVREAHWASSSHPDNPPWVRGVLGVVAEFAHAVWDGLRGAVRPDPSSTRWGVAPELLYLACVAGLVWTPPEAWKANVYSLSLLALLLHSTWFVVARRRRLDSGDGWRRSLVWLGDAVAIVVRPVLVPLVCLALVVLAILALAAVPINLLGMAICAVPRSVGSLLGKVRLGWLARWLHRFTWMILVLPVHSYLQLLKAFVNVGSILLTERGWIVRLRALLWLPALVAAALALLFFCEMLIVIPYALIAKSFAGDLEHGLGVTLVTLAIVYAIYLVLVRLFVPILDVLLDISNYHLASRNERDRYLEAIDAAVGELRTEGVGEVHLLAHSLGTVLVYDWLSRPAAAAEVRSLHTLGSPLDKFWFVDHDRERRASPSAIAAGLEAGWTNLWAWSDPISGALRRFDAGERRVANRRLRWLGAPLLSHSAYWESPVLQGSLRRALGAGSLAPGSSAPGSSAAGG